MSQHVLITGASSGFGAALVDAYAAQGWKVTATMRNLTKQPERFNDLDNVTVLPLDVTDQASINTAVTRAEQANGPIDVLANVAGFIVQGALEEATLDQWRQQFETNVIGLVAVTQAVLPGMRARHQGRILNFSSGAGLIGLPRLAAYSGSKFAVEGITESLARELQPLGIHVTMIEPGAFGTSLATSASGPENQLPDYDAVNQRVGGLFDFTPGNLEAAARAIVTISQEDNPPMRFYVGHGLDQVRARLQERLDEWDAHQVLTNSTK